MGQPSSPANEQARDFTGGQRLDCNGYDHHTHRELVALLGNGHTTIRTAPATFTRVADLAP
jgi:hypothetical protein